LEREGEEKLIKLDTQMLEKAKSQLIELISNFGYDFDDETWQRILTRAGERGTKRRNKLQGALRRTTDMGLWHG